MSEPNEEAHVVTHTISLSRCEELDPCIGCGRPTHAAISSPDGAHHHHICSPICLAMVEIARELVRASEAGEQAHAQVPIPHPQRKKEDLN